MIESALRLRGPVDNFCDIRANRVPEHPHLIDHDWAVLRLALFILEPLKVMTKLFQGHTSTISYVPIRLWDLMKKYESWRGRLRVEES